MNTVGSKIVSYPFSLPACFFPHPPFPLPPSLPERVQLPNVPRYTHDPFRKLTSLDCAFNARFTHRLVNSHKSKRCNHTVLALRRERNKKSAARSRLRQKEVIEALSEEIGTLEQRKERLTSILASAHAYLATIQQELRACQNQIKFDEG